MQALKGNGNAKACQWGSGSMRLRRQTPLQRHALRCAAAAATTATSAPPRRNTAALAETDYVVIGSGIGGEFVGRCGG